ncbi:hypothetical protein [Phreatobacter stygius]|nr:hypothetical protein [Phreatobacter stygius]
MTALPDWPMALAGVALVLILAENALAIVGAGLWFGDNGGGD